MNKFTGLALCFSFLTACGSSGDPTTAGGDGGIETGGAAGAGGSSASGGSSGSSSGGSSGSSSGGSSAGSSSGGSSSGGSSSGGASAGGTTSSGGNGAMSSGGASSGGTTSTGGMSTGGMSSGGAGGIGTGGSGATTGCGTTQCTDCIDNDGDGFVDGLDFECSGPQDNDEGSFATGIPGDNVDPKCQDCFFDGNSGQSECKYPTDCFDPTSAVNACGIKCDAAERGTADDCCSDGVTQTCLDACLGNVPNGCDCFGCCDLPGYSGGILIGPANVDCTEDEIDKLKAGQPSLCVTCTPSTDCENTCEECELCFGKTELPDTCFPGTGGTGGMGAGGSGGSGGSGGNGQVCSDGRTPCSDNTPCGDGFFCFFGCCFEIDVN